MAKGGKNTGLNPSRLRRVLRNLKSICCRWTKPKSDHAAECHCQPCGQHHEQTLPLLCASNSKESRAISPEYDAPDFRPWSVELRPIAEFRGSGELSNDQDDEAPGSSFDESEEWRASGVQVYQSRQTENTSPGVNGEGISPMINPETKHKLDVREHQQASPSRRDSLLENIWCLQSQISAQRENIGLSLGVCTDDILFEHQNKEYRRNIDELLKNGNNDSVLVNLAVLDVKINSLAALLGGLKTELSRAFCTMAWLAVHQIRGLGSMLNDLLSDMKKTDVYDGKITSRIQSNVDLSCQANLSLSNSAKTVNERCVFLVTRLEHLGLEAKAPKPSHETDVCLSYGKET